MYDPRRDKAVKRTFSIYQNLLERLEKESMVRGYNPSALLNLILLKWLSFDSPLEKINAITFA
jgi:hypothetical protein